MTDTGPTDPKAIDGKALDRLLDVLDPQRTPASTELARTLLDRDGELAKALTTHNGALADVDREPLPIVASIAKIAGLPLPKVNPGDLRGLAIDPLAIVPPSAGEALLRAVFDAISADAKLLEEFNVTPFFVIANVAKATNASAADHEAVRRAYALLRGMQPPLSLALDHVHALRSADIREPAIVVRHRS